MEAKFLLALFFAALLAFSAATDDGSGGDDSGSGSGSMGSWGDSFEDKDDGCDGLVEGSDDDDNEGKCDLTDGLEEVPDKADCTPEQKTIIINWVVILKQILYVKVSIEERLVLALSAIQKFQIEYPEIYEIIQYQNISSWGYLSSFTKVVEYRQSTKIESIFTLDDEDNCPLFDALYNGTDGSYEMTSAVHSLINETLIEICGNMSLTVKQRSVLIYQAIYKFFAINAEWQSYFFQFQISGFGSFQQFFEITRTFYQTTQVTVVLSGSSASECAFLVSFKNQLTLIQSDTTISMTEKKTLKLFYERMEQQVLLVSGSKTRLSVIVKEFNAFIKLYASSSTKYISYLYNIYIEGFGSFMDLIYCAPWNIGFPPKPTLPAGSTKAPTCSCTCASTTLQA